jgi:hypothetical protein
VGENDQLILSGIEKSARVFYFFFIFYYILKKVNKVLPCKQGMDIYFLTAEMQTADSTLSTIQDELCLTIICQENIKA